MAPELTVVLSRTQYPYNIGQVARAMSNLGFSSLELVQPPAWTEETFFQARQGAARGQAPLRDRREHASWSEFYASQPAHAVRIGFSRRGGRKRPSIPWEKYLAEELPALWGRPHLLIFGTEDSGLSSEDLDLVHHICDLPVYGPHASYSLSQAVLLALFLWTQNLSRLQNPPQADSPQARELTGQIFPEAALKEWLETLGFSLENRRVSALTVLKRLLLSRTPTPQELSVLEAVIQQTIRKLKAKNK